jgi:hypothetical protein
MINFALCFLAYGDEHINEFNEVCSKILQTHPLSNIFVLTNDESKIHNHSINIIKTQEAFNFNLKRYVIAEAFKLYDTIIMMDTDVDIKSFKYISDINSDGMYVKWITPKLTHKGNQLNMYNNVYCVELSKLNMHKVPIQFIPEFCIYLKITNIEKRKQFIERWSNIHNSIQQFEPTDRHADLNGAIEGCIMYLTSMDIGLPITTSTKLFESLTHYTSIKFKKVLI